jgi:hypothetical protein
MAIVMQGGFTAAENREIENLPTDRKLTRLEAILWVRYANFKNQRLTINSVAERLGWRWHDVKQLFEEKPDIGDSCRTSVELSVEQLSNKVSKKCRPNTQSDQQVTQNSANKVSKVCRTFVELSVEKLSNSITASVVNPTPYPTPQNQIQIHTQKQNGGTVLSTSTEPHSTSNLVANSELPPPLNFLKSWETGREEIKPGVWLSPEELEMLNADLGPLFPYWTNKFSLWVKQKKRLGQDVSHALSNAAGTILKWHIEEKAKQPPEQPKEDPEKVALRKSALESMAAYRAKVDAQNAAWEAHRMRLRR